MARLLHLWMKTDLQSRPKSFRRSALFLAAFLFLSACQPVRAGTVTVPTVDLPTLIPTPTTTPTQTPLPTSTATLPVFTPTPLPPSPTPTLTLTSTPAMPPLTTLLFTGVIVPARCVQAALDANGNPDYPYEEVRQVISEADISIGAFNATMSERVQHTGCVESYQLVGSPQNADALSRAGFDVMSVATNHIKDCGPMKGWCDYTFSDTLDNFRRVSILTVGAGKDLQQALQPVVVTVNGIRFGFVSLGNIKMDPVVFATDTRPGIGLLNEENIHLAVAAARQVSDVVIFMPHWGPEDDMHPSSNQQELARVIAAADVDLVVGNHSHVVQGVQELNGLQVFYSLGNFVFDQNWSDHRQGVILLVHFEGTRVVGYEFIPTRTDRDGRVHIAGPQEAQEILQRIEQSSQSLGH